MTVLPMDSRPLLFSAALFTWTGAATATSPMAIMPVAVPFALILPACLAMTATPRPFRRVQPDGSLTPPLVLRGDHRYHKMVEIVDDGAVKGGREVVVDEDGWYVYREDGTVFGGGGVTATDADGAPEDRGEDAGQEEAESSSKTAMNASDVDTDGPSEYGNDSIVVAGTESGDNDDSSGDDEVEGGGHSDGSEAPPLPPSSSPAVQPQAQPQPQTGATYEGSITRSEAESVFEALSLLDGDEDGDDIDVHSWSLLGGPEDEEDDEYDDGKDTEDGGDIQLRGRRRKRRLRRRRQLALDSLPPHRRSLSGPDLSEYARHLHTRRRLSAATSSDPAVLKCLVVLIRFSDHKHRALPRPDHFRHFFSKEGGHPQYAPTGSVHDWYWANSGRKFKFEATVSEWIDLPGTEAFYANNNWGWNEPNMQEGFYYALDYLDALPNFDVESFDHWKDGVLDAVCFVHSGIPSEWGDVDCENGADQYSRIWSHKSWGFWESKSKQVRMSGYFVGSGVWPVEDFGAGCLRCDENVCPIARIGVFAHELMHDLGCPDLYDGHEGGLGVGNYDCLGNSWGWDAQQHWPPNTSPWTKKELWWAETVTLDRAGTYTLPSAARTDKIFCVDRNFPSSEYLCIENRHDEGYDRQIPSDGGGLAVWHIDDKSWHHAQGHPGMPGWPQNGAHYRVALLAADGSYDLENANNFGDSRDLFRRDSPGCSSKIGPNGVEIATVGTSTANRPHPNTNAYQGGAIRRTDVSIEVISDAGPNLMVRLSGTGLLPALPESGGGGGNGGEGTVGGRADEVNTVQNGSGEGGGCAAIDKTIYFRKTNKRTGRKVTKRMECSEVKRKRLCAKRKFGQKLCRQYCASGCSGDN